jgi:acyl-CoA synthetase (AMP-forming)/AMP-acid ligase II
MVPLTHSNLFGVGEQHCRRSEADRKGSRSKCAAFSYPWLDRSCAVLGRCRRSVMCTAEFNAPEVLDWLEKFLPTWYTAVPTMPGHRRACQRKSPNLGRSSLRFIRSCSALLPAQVLTDLEDRFQVPVIEAYGTTEASHQ